MAVYRKSAAFCVHPLWMALENISKLQIVTGCFTLCLRVHRSDINKIAGSGIGKMNRSTGRSRFFFLLSQPILRHLSAARVEHKLLFDQLSLAYSRVQLLCFILNSCLQDYALNIYFFACLQCLVTVWFLFYVQPIHSFVSVSAFYLF